MRRYVEFPGHAQNSMRFCVLNIASPETGQRPTMTLIFRELRTQRFLEKLHIFPKSSFCVRLQHHDFLRV